VLLLLSHSGHRRPRENRQKNFTSEPCRGSRGKGRLPAQESLRIRTKIKEAELASCWRDAAGRFACTNSGPERFSWFTGACVAIEGRTSFSSEATDFAIEAAGIGEAEGPEIETS
jgi:hypothetical protein